MAHAVHTGTDGSPSCGFSSTDT